MFTFKVYTAEDGQWRKCNIAVLHTSSRRPDRHKFRIKSSDQFQPKVDVRCINVAFTRAALRSEVDNIIYPKDQRRHSGRHRLSADKAGPMDFVGQRLTDRLHQLITAIFGVIGFFYGYVHQRFAFTMYISMIGLGISALLCVPDWPFLNQNPLKWQEAM
eukprot:1140998-Amorphochlora_amoeboformis.AAC.2